MQNPLDWLGGYKTYVVGAGLVALAVYRASVGDFPGALESFMSGVGLLFARRAVDR